MPDYSFYENARNAPRVTKAVFVKYEIRNDLNNPIASGIATTKDISLGGLKFVCSAPARKNYIVKLEIQLDKLTKIGALGTVAWVDEPKHGQFHIGVQFQNLPEVYKQKIVKFLNSFAPKD